MGTNMAFLQYEYVCVLSSEFSSWWSIHNKNIDESCHWCLFHLCSDEPSLTPPVRESDLKFLIQETKFMQQAPDSADDVNLNSISNKLKFYSPMINIV